MSILLQKDLFPSELKDVLEKHIKNPPASSARDIKLIRELKKFMIIY